MCMCFGTKTKKKRKKNHITGSFKNFKKIDIVDYSLSAVEFFIEIPRLIETDKDLLFKQ